MHKSLLFFLLITITISTSFAQRKNRGVNCVCCSDLHKQFDFWIGEWDVYDKNKVLIGENTIEKLENDCLISENWKGASGTTGKSYNFFDTSDSTWNQTWVDNKGTCFNLKGEAYKNKVVLKSRLIKGENQIWYVNRISWKKIDENKLIQVWDITDQHGKLLDHVFEGHYIRKNSVN